MSIADWKYPWGMTRDELAITLYRLAITKSLNFELKLYTDVVKSIKKNLKKVK